MGIAAMVPQAEAAAPSAGTAAVAPPAAASPVVPTIDQLAAFPAISQIGISPDGKHLVALQGHGEVQAIAVYETANLAKPPVVFGSQNMKVAGVNFLKNDVLGVALWQPIDVPADKMISTFTEKYYLVDLDGHNWRDAMPVENGVTDDFGKLRQALASPSLFDSLPADPNHILVIQAYGEHSGDIYKVDVNSGRSALVMHTSEKVSDYFADLDGNIRGRTRVDVDAKGAYVATDFREAKSGSWQEHRRSYAKNHDVFQIVGFAKDPDIAYVETSEGGDKLAIYEYHIAGHQLGDVAFAHKMFDADGIKLWPYKDANFGEIMSFEYEGPREDSYDVSPRLIALKEGLAKALGITKQPLALVDPATGATAHTNYETGRYLKIESISQDMATAVVWAGSPNDPGAYYLYHDGRIDELGRPYPQLDPAILGSTALVYYKARDGLDIPAFLTKPSESVYGKGPWPLVVMPHGGPWSRDHMQWDWSMWPQLLASRGYAVLQPQYRGSSGWGVRLWRAGDAQWGLQMQDDKDDGAKWAIAQHIAEPGRIAMFGFSYGGYAAMDAAVRPNGIYKCAIAGAGVSDIRRIWAGYYSNPIYHDAQAPTVQGTSPVDDADKIGIPIMVYAGERDQTVPMEQSRWFVNKAKAAGKDVVYHQLPDYAHGPAWTRAIFGQQLQYIDDYLKTGCGGHGL